MDIVAHGLWAGAAAQLLDRRRPLKRSEVAAMLALAVAPDVIQLLPVLAWSLLQDDPVRLLHKFVMAAPGGEPVLPSAVSLVSHHLHCITHSAVIAALATLVLWRLAGRFWLPLAGWWLHIALDIPTHSDDYYAVPFLYPLTYWGFDGIAWTNPWFLAANYAALAITYAALFRLRPRRSPASD